MTNGTTTVALKTPVNAGITTIKNGWTEVRLAARRKWMEFHIKRQRPSLIASGQNDEQISENIAARHGKTMHPVAVQMRIKDMISRKKIAENPNPVPEPAMKNGC